jgi:hypothetical protein
LHDYDGDTTAPDWLQALADEYYQTEKQSIQEGDYESLSGALTDIAFSADMISMALNYGEVAFVDATFIVLLITGCASGPEGCAVALTLSAEVDYYVTTASPLGFIENFLGLFALGATASADLLLGNTKFSSDGNYIGIDTLVSGRNFVIGLVPETNVDYLVGKYQVTYDNDRRDGRKSGGSIEISRDNPSISRKKQKTCSCASSTCSAPVVIS